MKAHGRACIVVGAVGAKTSFIAICDGDPREVLRAPPPLDRDATQRLVEELVGDVVEHVGDSSLAEGANPPEGTVYAARYPRLDLFCDWSLALDRPSELPARYTRAPSRRVYAHCMHSVVDFFAFAQWDGGTLVRALSVSPDSGVIEDVGPRLAFEAPYWAGEHRVDVDDEDGAYPLPFHPLELGEEALVSFFGFHLEGMPTDIDPWAIPVAGFRAARRPSLLRRMRNLWSGGRR